MLAQSGEGLTFWAYYTASKQGKTGLTVTCDVWTEAGTHLVTAGTATEIGGGLYKYALAAGSNTTAGGYAAVFKTTDTTVDTQWLPALWVSGQNWVTRVDAATSTRATPAQILTTPANLLATDTSGYVTPVPAQQLSQHAGTAQAGAASTITLASGASATDHLYRGNVVVVTGGTGAGQARVITGYVGSTKVATVGRAWALNPDSTSLYTVLALAAAAVNDSLQVIASSVQGNVTGSVASVTAAVTAGTVSDKTGYSLTTAEHAAVAADAQTGLTAQGYTTARAGYLDTLNGLVAAIWAAATRTLTALGNVTVGGYASGQAPPLATDYTTARAAKLDNLDATVGSRNSVAPDNTSIAAIKAKTDNLPADPASNTQVATRLAASGYTAPLSAGGTANAVWDALTSAHTTAGSTGAQLVTNGAPADPLLNAVPGSYPAGSAGYTLGRLLIGQVTLVSPVLAGGALDLYAGAAYTPGGGNAPVWILPGTAPDLAGATVTWHANDGSAAQPVAVSGPRSAQILTLPLDPNPVGVGHYWRWEICATGGSLGTAHPVVVLAGTLAVHPLP